MTTATREEAASQENDEALFPSDALLRNVAARFRLLSDELRLKILIFLGREEYNVNAIVLAVHAKQSTVSKHLKVLTEGGLLACRRSGKNRYYHITHQAIFDLYDVMKVDVARYFQDQARAINP